MVRKKKNYKKSLRTRISAKNKGLMAGLLLVGMLATFLLGANARLFTAFGSGTDWISDVSMAGFYLPHEATRGSLYTSTTGASIQYDFDGDMITFGRLGSGYGFSTGSMAYVYDAVSSYNIGSEINEAWYDSSLDIYRREEYASWGQPGYFQPSWYPNLNNYYTAMPDTTALLGNLAHITGDSTADQVKVLQQEIPSVYGTNSEGYYYEEFMYRIELTMRIHADKGSTGDLFWGTFYIEGQSARMYNPHELAPIDELYVVFGVDTTLIADDILTEWADMATFGPHIVQFYEWDETGTFSKPISKTDVSTAMNPNNWPEAPWGWRRLNEYILNNDYLMSGYDPTMGLSVINPTDVGLNDDGKHYFMFGVDKIAIPAYYYQNIDIFSSVVESYGVFDLEVIFPLEITVGIIYDDNTGEADTRNVNTDGVLLSTNSTNPYEEDWKVQIATTLDIPVDMVVPVVGLGIIVVFVIFLRRR